MKYFLTLLFPILFSTLTFSQDRYDRQVYVYKTYDDYVNKTPENFGHFTRVEWSHGATIKAFKEDKRDYFLKVDEIWGFRIDKYTFRSLKGKYPAAIIKEKGKVFYINGSSYLNMIYYDSEKAFTIDEHEIFFYSNNLNSEIFEIKKLKNKEKENPEFNSLIDCLERAKKRYSTQGIIDSSIECIKNF